MMVPQSGSIKKWWTRLVANPNRGRTVNWLLRTGLGDTTLRMVPAANARSLVTVETGEFCFVLPDGKSAYLVEPDNPASFNSPQPRRSLTMEPGRRRLTVSSANGAGFPQGCSIYLIFCDQNGRPVGRRGFKLRDTAISAHFEAPRNASQATVCVRLTGSGRIPPLQLSVLPDAPQGEARSASTPHADYSPAGRLAVAQEHVDKWNLATASSLLEPASGPERHRLLIEIRLKQRAFGEALRLMDAAHPSFQEQPAIRVKRAEALANLGDFEGLSRLVDHALQRAAREDGLFLLAIYRYARGLDGIDRTALRLRCIAAAADPEAAFGAVVHLAHDVATEVSTCEARALMEMIAATGRARATRVRQAELDLLRAHILRQEDRPDQAIAAFQAAFGHFRLEPVPFGPGRMSLDQIIDAPTSGYGDGPRVSVLMPARNSGSTIDYAIRSILGQTHRNLELIVADDGSTDDTAEIAAEFRRKDRRVQVVRLGQPMGAYYARNEALARADGDLVITQDSDDWAHPRKLERLVGALASSDNATAVQALQIRLTSDGGLVARQGYIRPDGSSLMFRRTPVLEAIGYYDTPPAGADLEYQLRLERVFGPTLMREEPLSLVLASPTSLSSAGPFAIDPATGVFSPGRNAYRRELLRWQEKTGNLFIYHPQADRPFPLTDV